MHEQSLAYNREHNGEAHPSTLRSMINLANAYDYAGRFDEVEAIATQVIEKGTAALGPDHDTVRSARNTLISVLQQRGSDAQLNQAVALADESIAGIERTGQAKSVDMMLAKNTRGRLAGAPETVRRSRRVVQGGGQDRR